MAKFISLFLKVDRSIQHDAKRVAYLIGLARQIPVSLTKFVFMIAPGAIHGLHSDDTQICHISRYLNIARKIFWLERFCTLTPDIQTVAPRRYTMNHYISIRSGHSIEGSAERQDNRAHFRMNIAKDIGNAFPIKPH